MVSVFYEIWHMPLMTVNGRHVIGDVIRLCGGENVFAGVPMLATVVPSSPVRVTILVSCFPHLIRVL